MTKRATGRISAIHHRTQIYRTQIYSSMRDSCLGVNSWKKKSESQEWQDYQEIAVFPFPVFNPDLQEKLILLLAEEFTAEDCNTRWNEVLIFLQS